MLRATIDLGTNTCLLLIAEVDFKSRQVLSIKEDLTRFVRLGEGVDKNRVFSQPAMDRTLSALREYHTIIKRHDINPYEVICVATSSSRDSKNSQDFFDKIFSDFGFRFQVISGAAEAQATFTGTLLPDTPLLQSAVLDIGGGSTEFMCEWGGQSLDMGSVRFTERFFKTDPVTDEEFWACQKAIDSELESMKAWRKHLSPGTVLVAGAGTATTIGAVHLGLISWDRPALDALTLTSGDVHRWVEEFKWRNIEERKILLGFEPERADVILAGAMILWRTLEVLNFPTTRISTRGLRFGVLFNVPGEV